MTYLNSFAAYVTSLKSGREAGVFWELQATRKQNKSAGLGVRDRGHTPNSEPSVARRSPTANFCFSISSSKMSVLLGGLCYLSQVLNCVFLCNISSSRLNTGLFSWNIINKVAVNSRVWSNLS